MGYTHYFNFKTSPADAKKWKKVKQDFVKLYEAEGWENLIQYEYDESKEFEFSDDVIRFNGIEDDGHETFYLSRTKQSDFEFCKTACKPYDLPVCCLLILLKYYYGDAFYVSSDGVGEGYIDDGWYDALKVLSRIGIWFGLEYSEDGGIQLTPVEGAVEA